MLLRINFSLLGLLLVTFTSITPAYGLPNCNTPPPKLVFILDDSGSIDDNERIQMSVALQRITDSVSSIHPNLLVGSVQYGQGNPSTSRQGTYSNVMPYTNNPTIAVTNDPNLVQDHLPDSLQQMRSDGLFDKGGQLAEPDMFFIFTDARRQGKSGCCTTLTNAGTQFSTDAAPNFGEYALLAQKATTNAISLYQILQTPAEASPEVAQGSGVFRGANTFNVSNADIIAITNSIIANLSGLELEGDVTEVNLPITSRLNTNDRLILPSKTPSPLEGHLQSYLVDENGTPATGASWDAAAKMSSSKRLSRLFSSNSAGQKVLFNALNSNAFTQTSDLSVANIKDYTINPSASGGIYLAGRQDGSFLGGISRGNHLEVLSNQVNTSLYLRDIKYREHYKQTVSERSQQILTSSDDGFLYAFDYETGELIWAWMPRSLVSELTDFTQFQSKHLMAGTFDILDLKDSSGNYATYIVGSYKKGLGHYVLKLNAAGHLDTIVSDDDKSTSFEQSPNMGEMEFFTDTTGIVHAIYSLTNSDNTSQVILQNLTAKSSPLRINLNYEVTSSPFVMQDYKKPEKSPKKKTLYLGTKTGAIHTAPLLTSNGNVNTAPLIKAALEDSAIATLDDTPTDEVIYINSSVSAKDSQYYLSAQTPTRLTLFNYNATSESWNNKWTSYTFGAGTWAKGKYSADNSGVPTEDANDFAIIPPNEGIQSLPEGATITDKITIVADNIVLPLTATSDSSDSCVGKAYYYLYSLSDGSFPKKAFFRHDKTEISTNIALGHGDARKLAISDLTGKDQLIGYGLADQKPDFSIGLGAPFTIKDSATTGMRTWREIVQ